MDYNEGSEIVPLEVLNAALPRGAQPVRGYNRIQLLSEDALRTMVASAYNRAALPGYGEFSNDFPLCMDFAAISYGDVLRYAIEDGLAVRPGFGVLEYTQTDPHPRHAINFGMVAFTHKIIYFEPQASEWLAEPANLKSLDLFWI